jgi:hypothetical protein
MKEISGEVMECPVCGKKDSIDLDDDTTQCRKCAYSWHTFASTPPKKRTSQNNSREGYGPHCPTEDSMAKQIRTIGKDNWRGGETEVTFDEKTGEFTVAAIPGETFILKEGEFSEKEFQSYNIVTPTDERPMGSVGRLFLGGKWDDWCAIGGTLNREADCRFVAAAQLLLNIY